MERFLMDSLLAWKATPGRKPLILQGARQVGKTWLMKEFGKRSYTHTAYVNFESASPLKSLFKADFNVNRILAALEIETNQKILPSNTLLILDEIQEADGGLTALKYFFEQAPEYHVIAAGSLLGIALQNGSSFPVGKVDLLEMKPLSFLEFLSSVGEERLVAELRQRNWPVISLFHERLTELLRTYYFVGGMPEVVATYLHQKDLALCRQRQAQIMRGYENDFGKHVPGNLLPKIRLVWNHLLGQLAKENRKFIYGQLKKGARAKEFEAAIQWLVDAGLVVKVNRVEKPTLPMTAYADLDAFKLFFVDIGLLNAMGNVDARILLEKNKLLLEFKGALTEQFVCQQLCHKTKLYYWSSNHTAEVDFVFQSNDQIVPLEVKAEENLKSKSLKVFHERFHVSCALRTSMSPYREQDWLTNIPLYAIETII